LKRLLGEVSFDSPMNLSLCYSELNDFANAEIYLKESQEVCGAVCSDQSMAHIRFARGCIFLGLNQFEKAETEFLNSYRMSENINDSRMQLDNIYLLSEIFIKRKHMNKALRYLEQGEILIKRGIPFNLEMIKIYSRFAGLYWSIKKYEKASYYQFKYIQLKDSIYNEALTTNLMRIEADYMRRENDAEIAERDEIIVLKEDIINRQHILNIVTGLLGVIILAFSIILYSNYQQKRNLNLMLDRKINERTRELETIHYKLLALKERDLMIRQFANRVSETISTIKGLCTIASREVSHPIAASFLEKISITSCRLADQLKSFYHDEKIK